MVRDINRSHALRRVELVPGDGKHVDAQLLGIEDELGTVEEGKLADLVAVEGNPLDDISLMMSMAFVMKEGAIVVAP